MAHARVDDPATLARAGHFEGRNHGGRPCRLCERGSCRYRATRRRRRSRRSAELAAAYGDPRFEVVQCVKLLSISWTPFCSLVVWAFLLRLLMQLARADFRNPFAGAIVGAHQPPDPATAASSCRRSGESTPRRWWRVIARAVRRPGARACVAGGGAPPFAAAAAREP